MTIGEILSSNIGSCEKDGKLALSYKKTVCVRQYETEVMEASIEVPLTNDDIKNRLPLIEAIATAKIKYGVLFQLYAEKFITQQEWEDRKRELEDEVTVMEQYVNAHFGVNNVQ